MSTLLNRKTPVVFPDTEEAKLARHSSQLLTRLLTQEARPALPNFRLRDADLEVEIPNAALPLIAEVLTEMGKGNAVMIVPATREVTPQQAADLLGVSRPFVLKLIESQFIPYRRVGSHKRIRLTDILAYQKEQERRDRVMDELTAQAQELNMGY